jgi:hypothetical protein
MSTSTENISYDTSEVKIREGSRSAGEGAPGCVGGRVGRVAHEVRGGGREGDATRQVDARMGRRWAGWCAGPGGAMGQRDGIQAAWAPPGIHCWYHAQPKVPGLRLHCRLTSGPKVSFKPTTTTSSTRTNLSFQRRTPLRIGARKPDKQRAAESWNATSPPRQFH